MKTIKRPEPASRMEAAALRAIDTHTAGAIAATQGHLWGLVYELPNGQQLMTHGGTASLDSARDHMTYWLSKNPEANFDINNIRQMTQDEVDEITRGIRARYPRRRTLMELTGGEWTKALTEGWRVPGSRQRPPAGVKTIAPGWGSLGRW